MSWEESRVWIRMWVAFCRYNGCWVSFVCLKVTQKGFLFYPRAKERGERRYLFLGCFQVEHKGGSKWLK